MTAAIGQSLGRRDGRAKVTGAATYAADVRLSNAAHAVFVRSAIPCGALTAIDTAAAAAAPGVVSVFTHHNIPPLAAPPGMGAAQSFMPLHTDRIEYEGQPIALVVAETLEQASHAASLVRATYQAAPFETDFRNRLDDAFMVQSPFWPPESSTGDIAAAIAAAPVIVEETYRTSTRHHNPIEPSATIADWKDGALTLYDTSQSISLAQMVVAQIMGLPADRVRICNEVLGGGFGSKGAVWPHEIIAALVARELDRPVRLVLTRADAFTAHGYQAPTEQRLTLAADHDGLLRGVRHLSFNASSASGEHVELAVLGTRGIYAAPAIETRQQGVHVDRGSGTQMRAPAEGLGFVALEIAMDELAYKVGVDPLALRLRNYAEVHASSGKPFSLKRLRKCYALGAEQFGWSRRNPEPGSMREGDELVGWGMASVTMEAHSFPCSARVSIDRYGKVLIESGTQELGTGIYTIMPQIAADALGVAADDVRMVLGDTNLPPAFASVGSTTTWGVGSAVHHAAVALKAKLNELANHQLTDASSYGALVAAAGGETLSAEGEHPFSMHPEHAIHSFGAIFVEVRMDDLLRAPRVTRAVGVYDAGRIINPRTARSQMIGGIIWGIGQGLIECSEMDHRLGRLLSKNMTGYLLPVNADVADIEVSFIGEPDPHAGPLGVGELAAVGVGAAISNAVFHATGVRVREMPIRPEHLLTGGLA